MISKSDIAVAGIVLGMCALFVATAWTFVQMVRAMQ